MASIQCEGTHSLGIGFSWLKKANNRPKATWNMSQCETATYLSHLYSLSLAYSNISYTSQLHVIVSVFCLAIFCIPPLHVHFISTCAFLKYICFISACSDWHTALPGGFALYRVCTLQYFTSCVCMHIDVVNIHPARTESLACMRTCVYYNELAL